MAQKSRKEADEMKLIHITCCRRRFISHSQSVLLQNQIQVRERERKEEK